MPRRLRELIRLARENRNWYASRIGAGIATPLFAFYRPLLRRVAFIGVTGSCGKTTTKELIAGVLSSRFSGTKTHDTYNQPWHIVWSMFRAMPNHRYAVHEIGVGRRGQRDVFEKTLALVRPRIGVVTNIGTDHISAFGTQQAIAEQKGRLVEVLPKNGTAVLNADDPLVLAMAQRTSARVVTYGLSAAASLRARNVRCQWPGRLSFTVVHDGHAVDVDTLLCGEHWVGPVLASIAVAMALGMSLEDAARGLAGIAPFDRRMEPRRRADGVTFVVDDAKAPLWSLPAAFDFMKRAAAKRKVIVVGSISDYVGRSSDTIYRGVATQALDVADLVLFVGSKATKVLKGRPHVKGASLRAFYSLTDAHAYLESVLRSGDLVLLKGAPSDDLGTLMERRECSRATDEAASVGETRGTPAEAEDGAASFAIIGLGNPGAHHAGTRHNVGEAVVDRLAAVLNARWTTAEGATIATVRDDSTTVHLIKPLVAMNLIGPIVLRLARELGFSPGHCVLVHDEVGLPFGTVRGRLNGNDGGHNGVRSVLEAFGRTDFRRVKVGIGRPAQQDRLADHVLGAFEPHEQAAVESLCADAAERVLLLMKERAATTVN